MIPTVSCDTEGQCYAIEGLLIQAVRPESNMAGDASLKAVGVKKDPLQPLAQKRRRRPPRLVRE
eukprot:8615856-Pyramimonas_sp.AAC.1